MFRSPLMQVMVQAVTKASRGLVRDFGELEKLQVSQKSQGEFVSIADKRSEDTLYHELSKARPDFGFLMEESGEKQGKDRDSRWIIDPLDGTTNFLHGIPIFGISVALEVKGQIVAGVIYNPIMDELYVAEKGRGAFLNDQRLRVANRSELSECVIATGVPHLGRGHHARFLEILRVVMNKVSGVRRCGAAALDLAWLAAGRFDGFWEDELCPWDMAAGLILIQEAGGFVTDFSNGGTMCDSGEIVAGNKIIHAQLQTLVHEVCLR